MRADSAGLLRENQRAASRITKPRTRKATISGMSGLRRGGRAWGPETPGICGMSALNREAGAGSVIARSSLGACRVIQEGDREASDDTFALVTLYVGRGEVGNPIEQHNRMEMELCLKSNIHW